MSVRIGRVPAVAAGLVALAITVVGCSGGGAESGASGTTADRPAEAPGKARGEAPAGEGEKGAPKVGEPARAVVHVGTLTLEVERVDRAADETIAVALGADGYVGRDERSRHGADAEATVELRIPAEEFQAVLERIAKLGRELERDIAAEDVSEELIDLDSRIANMRESVKRTRALLARAQTIAEISTVERELTSRESDLAALEARKRALANRVEYSTLTVTLTGEAPAPPPPAEIGFLAGLAAGWHAFTVSVRVLLTALGAGLPFLVAVAVPVAGVLLLRHRMRRRRPGVAPEGAPGISGGGAP